MTFCLVKEGLNIYVRGGVVWFLDFKGEGLQEQLSIPWITMIEPIANVIV